MNSREDQWFLNKIQMLHMGEGSNKSTHVEKLEPTWQKNPQTPGNPYLSQDGIPVMHDK